MYQINLSIDEKKQSWIEDFYKTLESNVKNAGGVSAKIKNFGKIVIAVGCENENKGRILNAVRSFLFRVYLQSAKESFLHDAISFRTNDEVTDKIFFRALVAFDREDDENLLRKRLIITENFSIDGFFNFRLKELSEKWTQISDLTEDNGIYLYDEESIILLLRFILSAIRPKSERVTLLKEDDIYYILADGKEGGGDVPLNLTEMMLALVDIAPAEVVITPAFRQSEVFDKISSLFDVKFMKEISKLGEICENGQI